MPKPVRNSPHVYQYDTWDKQPHIRHDLANIRDLVAGILKTGEKL